MNTSALLTTADYAAREAGKLLRENFGRDQEVDAMHRYDIKLALDVRSQDLITKILLDAYPEHALYGEEGVAGQPDGAVEWIVDPIDGTVNYYYAIPHFCVSIAARERATGDLLIGAIYDPMMDEMWTAERGGDALLNGRPIQVSPRAELREAVVTCGFSKSKESIDAGVARFAQIAYAVRKTRMLGSAALAMAYIACGRLDAYIEEIISLWDVAAGQLIVERAGGSVQLKALDKPEKYSIVAQNGRLSLGEFGLD